MQTERTVSTVRWHSRWGFATATLFGLLAAGAGLFVPRAVLSHGPLFLPVLVLLVVVIGGPLARLGLAIGRAGRELPGRETLTAVQTLVRLTLVVALLLVGARAGHWLAADLWLGVPPDALAFRQREVTPDATAWHGGPGAAWWLGLAAVAMPALLLWTGAGRRRIAGMAWLTGWLLPLAALLLGAGLAAGLALPGAGALLALAAPLRWDVLSTPAFWADAFALSLLAVGALTGVVTSAGAGLPRRAPIGPEARVLVAGAALLVTLCGLAGLLLLSALCLRQGVVPRPEHAAPGVLLLEVVPALARDLFANVPAWLRPDERQVTRAWCFVLLMACAAGAATLLASRPLRPRGRPSAAGWFGVGAAASALAGVVVSWRAGQADAWAPLVMVLPGLLALVLLTLARRPGAGLRVATDAFAAPRPWLERLMFAQAFVVARPLLLLGVLAAVLARPEHAVPFAGFALAFALMWLGSLSLPRRPGVLRPLATAGLLLLTVAPVFAAPPHPLPAEPDGARRKAMLRALERELARGGAADVEGLQAAAGALLHIARAEDEAPEARALALAKFRDVVAALCLAAPAHEETLRLERALLAEDGLHPLPRLDEAMADHLAGRPGPLIARLSLIQQRTQGAALAAALARPDAGLPELLTALVDDLRVAHGAAGPLGGQLRRYLLQRATFGATLLRPDPAPGLAYLAALLGSALALAAALWQGRSRGGALAPRGGSGLQGGSARARKE
jgi:hypothetical protein